MLHGKNIFFERNDFMKFKVVDKNLILTDCSRKITEGENLFDSVEIAVPHYHDDCNLSALSFRFSEISENGENSAVQVLRHTKCDEKYIYLKGMITSDFTAITGKVIFMLTGVSGENVAAKFQSAPYTISDDISLTSLPNESTAEQLFNQAQLEIQKAIDAADRAEAASQTPAPAEIYPASEEKLGGVLSGNDISVSGNGSVTVNSVNGKSLGKSVPADAVFTDTVYTLPKATTEILGGVKVDGTTITASSDGTISAPDSKNLKSDIKNTNALAVQIAHSNNYLIYDDAGKPSVMVAISKFYLDDVINGASHTVHPAFIINGIEHDVIYISKYQNIVENGRAYSLPMKAPQTYVTFEQACNYCSAKGAGWHVMTNAEWAAIALWCKKNGTMPKGNNYYGKDVSETSLPPKAAPASKNSSGNTAATLTGSGRESWYHDGTFAGIADLNGNVWEWNSGTRLVNGEIQIIANNDAANQSNSALSSSTLWKAIMPDGTLAAPETPGTLKWDYGTNPTSDTSNIILNNKIDHMQTDASVRGIKEFNALTSADQIEVPEIMKALAFFPADSNGYGHELLQFRNSGVRLSLRGGAFRKPTGEPMAAETGVFTLDYLLTDGITADHIGFRSAYYGNI